MHPFSFCPNPTCPHHQVAPEGSWYVALGFYYTKCFGDVPRYRCKTCGRTFSSQTFSLDYFAKKRLDYRQIERLVSSSMSQRALSRHFKVSLGTINNRIQRLSHQSLATHTLLRPQAAPREPVCIDGFVSFDRSQYFPNNITISLTAHSQFILSLTHATLRRSGRCTDAQKHRKTCSIAQSPSKRLPSNALSQSSSISYIANAVLLSLLHHCSSPTKNLTMHGHSLAILAVSLSTISPSILRLLVPYITHCLLPTI